MPQQHAPTPTALISQVASAQPMLTSSNKSVANRVAFYHAAMLSPIINTWCQALDAGFLTTWPDLTSAQVRCHPPFSVTSLKGNLDQQQANLRSTKPLTTPTFPTDPNVGANPPAVTTPNVTEPLTSRTHNLFVDCQLMTGKIATDQTERFLVSSSRDNSYLLMVYDYNSNYIHAEPLKSRAQSDILAGYQRTINLLTKRGLKPVLQQLDNEASQALQSFMTANDIDYQMAPSHVHRGNSTERAIRTFKNHSIAGLCGTDPDFPLHLWDRLLPQAILTLNLLRASRINPLLSAQAQLHGAFDYNRTPLAPAGTRVMMHEKSSVRGTWAPHAVDGWYLGPAMHHYRCYRVYVKETSAERIADTLVWFPKHVSMPVQSSNAAATAAAQALISALLHPAAASPISAISDQQREALHQLSSIFSNITTNPSLCALPPGFTPPLPENPSPSNTVVLPRVPTHQPFRSPTVATPLSAPPPVPVLESLPEPALSLRVTPLPNTSAPKPLTYAEVTINANQWRRRAAKIPIAPALIHNTRNQATRQGIVQPAATPFADMCSAFGATPLSVVMDTTKRTDALPSPSAHAVLDPNSGAAMSFRQLRNGPEGMEWQHSAANEIGRLAQGVLRASG